MIVCVCNNVSDREIRQAVEMGCSSMEELTQGLGVAAQCGGCLGCAKEEMELALASRSGAGALRGSVEIKRG